MKNFKKGLIYAGVLAFCIGFGAYIYCNSIKKKIPDKLYIYKQDKAVFSMDIPVSLSDIPCPNAANVPSSHT